MDLSRYDHRQNLIAWMAAGLAVIAIVFGGASQEHEVRLAFVELASLPLLAFSLREIILDGRWREVRTPLAILGCVLALPLVQLIPLPFGLWSLLPGRQALATGLSLAEVRPAFLPLSMAPERTWGMFLALLPPAAMFLAVLSMRASQQRRMMLIYLGAAACSVLLGAAQLAAGGRGPLYLYETVSLRSAVGFFSNRNHLAALLVGVLPLAAVLVGEAMNRRSSDRGGQIALSLLFALVTVVAIGAVQSRAGIMLAAPALLGALLVAWRGTATGGGRLAAVSLGAVGVMAGGVVAVFSLSPILKRFSDAGDGRLEHWPLISDSAGGFLPLGSGLGSFDNVFRSVELLDDLDNTFLNHAHNDYLELWLETGWLGAALLIAFLVWYGRRTWLAWLGGGRPHESLARACALSVGLLMLHSVVDYPLRTETLAVFFAFCCAVLAAPAAPPEWRRPARD